MNEAVTYLEQLREIALDQHGFVTAAQAVAASVLEWNPRQTFTDEGFYYAHTRRNVNE